MKKNSQIKMLVYLLIIFLMSGCAGTKAVGHEAWKITKVLTIGESKETKKFPVEVRNCCGIPDVDILTCTAGTSSGIEVNLGASFGVPSAITIDPSVGSSLGFSKESGAEITVGPPPLGYVEIYMIEETYIIETGDAEVLSSSGKKEVAEYSLTARCELDKELIDSSPCSEKCAYEPAPSPTPEVIPTATPVPTATTVPTPTISPPAITNLVFCSGVCNGKNETTEYRNGTNYIYAYWEHQNIPEGARYERIWTMEGIEWVRYECKWNDDLNGQPIHGILRDLKGLHDGNWTMTIKVDGKVIQSGSVKVSGGETYLETAPPQNTCFETPPP